MSKINVRMLRRIQKQILKEPKQFAMANYFQDDATSRINDEIPNCGTACCIGGWAIVLNVKGAKPSRFNNWDILRSEPKAQRVLGLTDDQASRLFYAFNWPEKFTSKMTVDFDSLPAKRRAKLAVARIEHFIKTKGSE